jgi:hypothetical protein
MKNFLTLVVILILSSCSSDPIEVIELCDENITPPNWILGEWELGRIRYGTD